MAGRGDKLRHDVLAQEDVSPLTPMQRELLTEACRIVDRLDQLDALIRGDIDWLTLEPDHTGGYRLTVDSVLAEARQHALALKTLETALRRPRTKSSKEDTDHATPAAQDAGEGALDVLARRRAARRASATGS
jgi:hypothetical protein